MCIKIVLIFITLILAACNPQRKEVTEVRKSVSPNIAEKVNINYITASLKQKGFNCVKFDNVAKKQVLICSRDKGEGLDACNDSIWLEGDGQNHVISSQQFYECDNERKMVITPKQ